MLKMLPVSVLVLCLDTPLIKEIVLCCAETSYNVTVQEQAPIFAVGGVRCLLVFVCYFIYIKFLYQQDMTDCVQLRNIRA